MSEFFNDFKDRVMLGVSDDQLKSIYTVATFESEKMASLEGKLQTYNGCLAVLSDL